MNGKLLATALLAASLAGLLWFVTRSGSRGEPARAPELARARPTGEGAKAPAPLEPAAAPAEETDQATGAERDSRRAAVVPAAATSSVPAGAARPLEVTVVVPPGLPADDEPELVAIHVLEDSDFDAGDARDVVEDDVLWDGFVEKLDDMELSWSRAPLAGRSTLAVHRDARRAWLFVRSNYLYLAPQEVDLEGDEPVVLEPELGGWISGVCVLPPGAEELALTPDEVDLELDGRKRDGGFAEWRSMDARDVRIAEDWTFEVRGLAASRVYAAHAEVDGLADWLELRLTVEPGQRRRLEIPFRLGGTVTGRVVGDDGTPVGNAEVSDAGRGRMFGRGTDTETDDEGRYELRGLAPGKLRLTVEANGWLEPEPRTLEIAEGQTIEGVDFVLAAGNRVRGRVVWPDGEPAVGVAVVALGSLRQGWREDLAETTTDAAGAFALGGLEEGPFELRASIRPSSEDLERLGLEAQEVSEPVEAPGEWEPLRRRGAGRGPQWVARALGVEPGATDLELALAAPHVLAGRVVDAAGAPVERATVQAKPAGDSRWSRDSERTRAADGGAFRLPLPYAGDWTVSVDVEGYAPVEESVTVAVPTTAELTLVVRRAGVLAGVVVDPFGAPVEGAEVTASDGADARPDGFPDRDAEQAETDAAGRFELPSVAERVTLVAEVEGWADSEPLALELALGESRDDLVLTLRVGATITGEVFDAAGEPLAAQNVTAGRTTFGPFGGADTSATTDAQGRFRIEHVTPGKVTVTAMPSQEELFEKMSEATDETAFIGLFSEMTSTTVEVADGEEVHVVLGKKAKDPVRVHGRVTEAGTPLANAMVLALTEGDALFSGMKAVRTDAGGRYELEVDRPGDYVFAVQREGFGGAGVQFFVDVPEVPEVEHDLALPLGRISGRVLGPDGAPASGVPVHVGRDGGILGIEELDQSSNAVTGGDGAFRFEHLHPGTYALAVGGGLDILAGGAKKRYAARVVSGIEVKPDGAVDGVEVRLEAPGVLEGVVRDAAGEPVGGATVFARDASGRALSRLSGVVTDAAGRFTYEGLPPGPVSVLARTAELCSADSGPIEIAAGATSEVELVVDTGAYLVVSLLDDGEPVRARLRVLDEAGREVNGLVSFQELQDLVTSGISSKERRVGPVPPGKYRLEATAFDGKDARKTVRLRAGANELNVKLRLKD